MKQRVIFCTVALLALLAVFGIPTVHGAEAEPEIRIDNAGKSITVAEANAADVLGDGTVRYTSPRDAEPAVLSLRGAKFDRLSVVGGPLILEITGENTVSGVVTADDATADDATVDENLSVKSGMTVNGKLTVRGAGTLTVTGGIVILEAGSITTEMQVLANNVEKPEGAFEIAEPNADEYLSPYIRFEPISHDVLYHDDTCDDNLKTGQHYNGMPLILLEEPFSREGYTQIGWRDGKSGKTYELGAEIKEEDAGTDYYPVWEVNCYKVTFDFGGGGENVVLTLAYGMAIEVPEIPVWVGHRFCGWTTQIPDTVPAKDLTLQAIWALCDHSGNTAARSCVTETVCSVCGAKLEKVHCAEEDDGDCTTPVTCRICGVVLREACDAHRLSEWESLPDGRRYRKCVNDGCSYTETERVLPPPTTEAETGTDSTPDSEPDSEPVSEPDSARTSEPETTPIGKTEPETSADLPESGTTTRPTADTAVYGPAKPDSDASRPDEKHGCASTLPNLPVLLVLAAFSLFRRRE